MSYILDALRKSEQERQRGTVPAPLTIQVQVLQSPGRRTRLWYVAAVVPPVLAICLGGWWLLQRPKEGPGIVAAGRQQQKSALSQSLKVPMQVMPPSRDAGSLQGEQQRLPGPKQPLTLEPATSGTFPQATAYQAAPAGPAVKEVPAAVDRPLEVPPADQGKIYRTGELPAAVQKGLPPVALTAFMYSRDPASRMVRINDRMMQEGQELGQGVRLLEITPDGVVLTSAGYRFFVPMK